MSDPPGLLRRVVDALPASRGVTGALTLAAATIGLVIASDPATLHDKFLDRKLRNDLKQPVRFEAVASIPCFELWLLLHFEDVRSLLHRDEVSRTERFALSLRTTLERPVARRGFQS